MEPIDQKQRSSSNPKRGLLHELRTHLLAHSIYAALAFVVGILLFSSTTFENATYMKEGEEIGPSFQTKLRLARTESYAPMCSFRAGPPDQPPLSITRGDADQIGNYEIDLLECDSNRKFAVLHVHQITLFYRAMDALWHILGFR